LSYRRGAMGRFFWICLAGALGTGVRYLVGIWAGRALGASFPYGTFIVNVVGSFLIGAIMHVALTTDMISPTLRLTLTTGFMGGLTTYSTFNYETLKYFEERAWGAGLTNVGVTLFGCLGAGVLGLAVARRLAG
jgi:CrcB protein